MGLWDVFDYVVRKPVSKAYASWCAAVSKIDESVGSDGVKQKMKEYLPSPESRERFAQALNHPATQEALKLVVPGGAQAAAAYKFAESVLVGNNKNQNDIDQQKKHEHVIQQMKILKAENEILQAQNERLKAENEILQAENERLKAENERMQKELNNLVTTTNNSSSSSTVVTVSEQKPEEVITESMTKGHKTKEDLLDNHRVIVVPSKRRSKL